MTEYYKSIREKATEVPGCFGDSWKIGQKRHLEEIGGEGGEDAVAAVGADGRKLDDLGFWPGRICNIPMQGRSLWGPRYDPMRSSLLTIMKPNVFGDVDPSIKTNAYVAGPVYQPPDRPAPWMVPPDESEPFAPLIVPRRFLTPEEERDDRRGQLRTVHSKPHHGYRGNREATARALNVSVDSNGIMPCLGLQVSWGLQGEDAVAAVGADGRKLDDLGFWPGRICNIPMQGRSLWGPRYDPMRSSLLTIMKPNVFGDVDPSIKTNAYVAGPVYQPPDRPAPWMVPPDESEPFAPLIVPRRFLTPEEERDDRRGQLRTVHSKPHHGYRGNREATARALNVSVDSNGIMPCLGLQVSWGLQGVCDGSSHHWCDKIGGSSCLMTGSQDNRGTACFNSLSGWLVLDVKDVKHGFIGARMEAWGDTGADGATEGWTEVNNGGRGNYDKSGQDRRLHEEYQERMRVEFVEQMKRLCASPRHGNNTPRRAPVPQTLWVEDAPRPVGGAARPRQPSRMLPLGEDARLPPLLGGASGATRRRGLDPHQFRCVPPPLGGATRRQGINAPRQF